MKNIFEPSTMQKNQKIKTKMKVKNQIFDSSFMQKNQSFLQKNTNFDFFAARDKNTRTKIVINVKTKM